MLLLKSVFLSLPSCLSKSNEKMSLGEDEKEIKVDDYPHLTDENIKAHRKVK